MLLTLVVATVGWPQISKSAEISTPRDGQGLTEVRHAADLPSDVAALIGWHHSAKDNIADFNARPDDPTPTLPPDRWFLLGGTNSTYTIVAWQERRPSASSFHAKAFSSLQTSWAPVGEWIVGSPPHTLDDLLQMLHTTLTQTLTDRWIKSEQAEQQWKARLRQRKPYPYRRDGPWRELNISDDEVREIQGLVLDRYPGSIVTISGVVKGCPCEDGLLCQAQVWIAAYRPDETRELELSQINDHWTIGPVQQWWLDKDAVAHKQFPSWDARRAADQTLDGQFPYCPAPPAPVSPGSTH
jgi:hypothetical protein